MMNKADRTMNGRTAGIRVKGRLSIEIDQEICPSQLVKLLNPEENLPQQASFPQPIWEDALRASIPFSRLPPQEKEFVDEQFIQQPQSGAIPEILLRMAQKRFSNPNVYPVSGGMYSYGEPGASWNG